MLMKKKIAKVLTICNDCEHLIVADNRNDSSSNFAICMFKQITPIVVLDSQTTDVLSYKIAIPEFCGLEDYRPNRKSKGIEEEEE